MRHRGYRNSRVAVRSVRAFLGTSSICTAQSEVLNLETGLLSPVHSPPQYPNVPVLYGEVADAGKRYAREMSIDRHSCR
jgi:hypothetical protein